VDAFPARSDARLPAGQLHARGHKRRYRWPYLSLSDLRKSCAAVHEAIVLCARTPGHEVGLMMRLPAPKKEIRHKYLDKLTVWKLKLYIFWWHRITAIAENHNTRRKSRWSRRSWIRNLHTSIVILIRDGLHRHRHLVIVDGWRQLFTVAADRRCSCVRGWRQILSFDISGVCSGTPNDRA